MIPVNVAGIPALAHVTWYQPAFAGRGVSGPVSSYAALAAPEDEDVEFELYDRKGYPAPWLEAKLEGEVAYDVTEQVLLELREEVS